MPWTCPGCSTRWNRNKLRCDCGRKQPKRRRSHRDVLAEMPYEEWVERYGEVCGICGRGPSGSRRLDRDHDHKTGLPRGLLCWRHNKLLNRAWTPELLRAAAAYLDRVRSYD